MLPNHSPWIKQLKRTRPITPLHSNLTADVAIVGGGIAGVTTAFFTLRNTHKSVVLIEADRIAHGATGHNAGQITSYFERPLSSLVEEFGFDLAIDGQASVEGAWELLELVAKEARLETPFYRFTGYTGLSTFEEVTSYLENNRLRKKGGLRVEDIVIAEEWVEQKSILQEYKDLYTLAKQKDILALLESNNTEYIASVSFQKGCMNSALFSEELVGYLLATHRSRFTLHEESPMKSVRLHDSSATLTVLDHTIEAKRVVLCTNGFEYFTIQNDAGKDIDTEFHHSVAGRIGYMSGYVEPLRNPPTAISYFPKMIQHTGDPTGDSYFYLTRRPHEHEGKSSYNLVCAGGSEKVLPNDASYSREDAYPEEIRREIDGFMKDNYNKYPTEAEFSFTWHGLMGYTPNGIRRVGPEPCNPVLIYNLGCNGVGILPSLYGADRISKMLNGEKLEKSIFDPHDQR